jgi:signal transduction histidine kinase
MVMDSGAVRHDGDPAAFVEPRLPALAHPPPSPIPMDDQRHRVRDVLPALLRQVPVGVGVVRADRVIAYHNDEFGRIHGMTGAGDDPAAPALAAFQEPDGSAFGADDEPLDRLLGTGVAFARRNLVWRRDDGTPVPVAVAGSAIVDATGSVLGAVLYVEDRTEDLDEASVREAFVGVLAHELRTPMTAIYGGMQLLRADRLPPDLRATVIGDIAAEAEHLHRLVEDLVALARIEYGLTDVRFEPLSLQHLVRQAAYDESRRWSGHEVVIEAAGDLPAARGDDGYVRQILRNLVSNAVKYSPDGSPVVIRLAPGREGVAVSVLDRGRGFPPETGPDAFRLFHQSPTVAAHVAGTGIGLFVARALVEALGGRIWLRNRGGGGAEVGFSLPVYEGTDAA